MFTHAEQAGHAPIRLSSLRIPTITQGYVFFFKGYVFFFKGFVFTANCTALCYCSFCWPVFRYLIASWWFCKHLFCFIILLHYT